MKIIKSILIWLCLIPFAILNGGFREYILHPTVPSPWDLTISGIILCCIIIFISQLFLPYLGETTRKERYTIAFTWLILTILFETTFKLSVGYTLYALLQTYNPIHGNLWLLVVVSTVFSPLIILTKNNKQTLFSSIILVTHNKKKYLPLLLLADEQESMIDRYLEKGDLFIYKKGKTAIASAVITKEKEGIYELKNLAVMPDFQRKGYGKKMINFIWKYYPTCKTLYVGTGNTPSTLSFYTHYGFVYSHTLPNFFTENYDHPIIEEGTLLKDMIYLKMERK